MISMNASAPARFDQAVIFAADGPYARFALHAAAQIATLHPDRDFDICLAGLGMAEIPPSLAGLGVRAIAVDPGSAFDGLRLDPGRTPVVYLRLALPEALSGDYRRLLYLDSDIFVQSGDFSALLRVPLDGRRVGAVRDNSQWRAPHRRPSQFKVLGLAGAPYFNAGVMLIDVERWTTGRLLEQAASFGRAHRKKLLRHDQNLLNAILHGDWAELSPAWNWQYTRATMLFEAMEDPHVIHFIGPRKPWSDRTGTLPNRFRRSLREFAAAHFRDAPPVGPDGRSPLRDAVRMRDVLLRHLLGQGRMASYLDRFPSDLTVLDPRSSVALGAT